MEPGRNLRKCLLSCLVGLSGCTGYVRADSGPAPLAAEESAPSPPETAAVAAPPAAPAGAVPLPSGVPIAAGAVYQGVKVAIAGDGAALPARNADLVQNREALVRVFVTPR